MYGLTCSLYQLGKDKIYKIPLWIKIWFHCKFRILTCKLSPSRHTSGVSAILQSTPMVQCLGICCLEPWPDPLTWWSCGGPLGRGFRHRITVNVTSPLSMSKSQVMTPPFCGTWMRTCIAKTSQTNEVVHHVYKLITNHCTDGSW